MRCDSQEVLGWGGQAFPETLTALHRERYLLNGKVYGCPAAAAPAALASHSEYVCLGAGRDSQDAEPETMPLAYCGTQAHRRGWVPVLFADGRVGGFERGQNRQQLAARQGWQVSGNDGQQQREGK